MRKRPHRPCFTKRTWSNADGFPTAEAERQHYRRNHDARALPHTGVDGRPCAVLVKRPDDYRHTHERRMRALARAIERRAAA